MTLKSEITHAVDASNQRRNQLGSLLQNTPDQDIKVSREFLSSIWARLGNDIHVLGKCFDNVTEPE